MAGDSAVFRSSKNGVSKIPVDSRNSLLFKALDSLGSKERLVRCNEALLGCYSGIFLLGIDTLQGCLFLLLQRDVFEVPGCRCCERGKIAATVTWQGTARGQGVCS